MMPACAEFAWPIDKDAAAEAMVRRHVPGWAAGPVTVTAAPNLGLHSSIYFANATSSFSVVARLVDKTQDPTTLHNAATYSCYNLLRLYGAVPTVPWYRYTAQAAYRSTYGTVGTAVRQYKR